MKNLNIENNRKKYVVTEGSNFKFRSKNGVFFGNNEKINHILAKTLGGVMIIKWGDIKFTDEILIKIKDLAKAVETEFKAFPKVKRNFITEAVPKLKTLKDKGVNESRRIDLVRLEDEEWFEWENKKSENKDNSITTYLK